MKDYTISQNFYKELQKLIKFPEGVKNVIITLKHNECVILELTMYAERNYSGEEITERYYLKEAGDCEIEEMQP